LVEVRHFREKGKIDILFQRKKGARQMAPSSKLLFSYTRMGVQKKRKETVQQKKGTTKKGGKRNVHDSSLNQKEKTQQQRRGGKYIYFTRQKPNCACVAGLGSRRRLLVNRGTPF